MDDGDENMNYPDEPSPEIPVEDEPDVTSEDEATHTGAIAAAAACAGGESKHFDDLKAENHNKTSEKTDYDLQSESTEESKVDFDLELESTEELKVDQLEGPDEGRTSSDEANPTGDKLYSREDLQCMLRDGIIYRLPDKDLTVITRAGADVNAPITKGLRPVHYAAFDNHCDGLRFLIDNSARINVHDNVGYTPVHLCAKHGHYDSLKLLLDHGAYATFVGQFTPRDERNAWAEVCTEPINLALEYGHIDCARLLLQYGARVDNRYSLGSEINLVPLENLECLSLLLHHKADPDVLSRTGDSPLMSAGKEQNLKAANLLLAYGADVNLKSSGRFEEKTALYFCILSGNCEMLALLLENGVDLCANVSKNNLPLTFAVSRDKYMMSEILIAFGADVNERNVDGFTPLLAACTTTDLSYQIELVLLLLKNGADPNLHHHIMRYYTPSLAPIHEYFVFNRPGRFEALIPKLLIKYGARVTFCPAHNQSVIQNPFSMLNHIRKLELYPDVYDLLLCVAESFDASVIRSCDLISNEKRNQLLSLALEPLSLKHACRLYFRRHLGLVLPDKVELLPLPKILKSYLLFYI